MKKNKLMLIILSSVLLFAPCLAYAIEEESAPSSSTSPEATTSPEPSKKPTASPEASEKPSASPEASAEPVEVKVTLNKQEVTLNIGEKEKLKVTIEGTKEEASWTTGDANVATVVDGQILATGAGETNITATVGKQKVSCKVTVKAPEKKLEYTLSKVTIRNGSISPGFNKKVNQYTVTIDSSVNSLDLVYSLTDDKKEGTVKNTYEFKIVKEINNVNLKSLKITGYALNEEFTASNLKYTATIPYSIDTITIQAVPEDEGAQVTCSGNTNLRVGENLVNVVVRNSKGTTNVYEINVTRSEETVIEENPTSIITSSMVIASNVSTDSVSSSKSTDDSFLKYFIVSIACLILCGIGGIGVYFYVKTSPRKLKKELVEKKKELEENPIIEVPEESKEETKEITMFEEEDLMETKEFNREEINPMEESNIENEEEKDA